MKAWHFAQDDMTLGYDDGRKIIKGRWLTHKGDLELCCSGLHASKRITDALQYARGHSICRVELGGKMLHEDDKSVAQKRKVLWYIPAHRGEKLLRRFACMCALGVAHLWDMPDIVRQYLTTQDESTRAAAWDAARVAARVAARAAARAATWVAAGDAARVAARVAAGDAARVAARDAARVATWDAAGVATWDAAGERQNRRLTSMALAEHRRKS